MNGSATFRHRNTPSQRYLGFGLQPQPQNPNNDVAAAAAPVPDDDFDEDEVFWTGDFSESSRVSEPPSPARFHRNNQYQKSFRHVQNFGILAALPEDDQKRRELGGERSLFNRKPSIPSSPSSSSTSSSSSRMMMIQAIPRPQVPHEQREYSQSMPVNIPVCSRMETTEVPEADDEDAENEMLPPHELIAKRYRLSGVSTFSVLEGVGRTLKGRDLRQVRNAVLQKTGFLD